MTDIRTYQYTSVLAPYIEGFLEEKRKLGFICNGLAYQLSRMDKYWNECGYHDPCITFEKLDKWLQAKPGEGKTGHGARVRASKFLAIYLNTLGIPAYVPLIKIGECHPTIHVVDKGELEELFLVIDHYVPESFNPAHHRMAKEYPVLFRLYYCCGLRNNEGCSIAAENVDFDKGVITILDGKNHKNRLVYLPEDLNELLNSYYRWLTKELDGEPYWVFPGQNPNSHISKFTVDGIFAYFWNQTEASKKCDRHPTPHCLRHAFVVDRINGWIKEGLDQKVMLMYLSKYLGHKDPDETFYYYHMVSDAFQIIREKDTVANDVIPEVRRK